VKRSVVPYRTYPLADLPESLQERLKNRQTPDPDFDYQSVISFSGRAWTTFVLQFLIVPAFIYGLALFLGSLFGAVIALLLLYPLCVLSVNIERLWRRLFPGNNWLSDKIYITTHYIIVVRRQAVTYFPMADISKLEITRGFSRMNLDTGEWETGSYCFTFKHRNGDEYMKVSWAESKWSKLPHDLRPSHEIEVRRAKSHGMYEAQDDLALVNS
jgi:hypothetical protein